MDSPSQFKELLHRLGRTDEDAVTICYQSPAQRFTAKTIKVDLVDSVVDALDDLGNNIWFEINPSSVTGRATAQDITRLAGFYIDIDYKDGGAGSARNAKLFMDMLTSLIGVGPSAIVFSGHGIQPYWSIDTEEEYDFGLAQGVLNRWGVFCKFLGGTMDTSLDSVFDLPRIFRVPGSQNMKDAENPKRVSAIFPKDWRPVSIDEINEILIAHGITNEHSLPDSYDPVSTSDKWQYAAHDCQFTPTLYAGIRPTNGVPKSRHGWLLQQLVLIHSAHRNGCITPDTKEDLIQRAGERFEYFLTQGLSRPMNQGEIGSASQWAVAKVETFTDEKLRNELRQHSHSDFLVGDPTSVLGEPSANVERSQEELALLYESTYGTYGRTDAANARRLVYYSEGRFKYVPDVGWYFWDGGRYVFDKDKSIMQMAIDAAQFVEQTQISGDQLKWAQGSSNKERIVNAITLAGTDPEVLVQAIELDSQANDLCTPNGIVNLQTGEIRPAVKGLDLNTRQTTVTPKTIPTPIWDSFLREVIQEEDRINYLQELLGASLFGDARYHVLPVLAGSGANGKSTLLDVVAGILGDYSASMPENFLLDTSSNTHPTEIARLRGIRFAMASETRPDGKFNESRVKMLTGGDMLSARFMNKNFFDFRPTHTLFLAVNHLPAVKSGGDGFWRRLRKMDFKVTIPKERQKENFAQLMIETEGAGILDWMVKGAVRVTVQNFNEPDSVRLSTLEYRHEEDHIAKFLDERVVAASNGSATKTAVFNAYRDWCDDNGERPITQNALNREVRSRMNVPEVELMGIRMFSGIELLSLNPTPKDMAGEQKDEYWR
jgi:P4 family phage/plasmid primase-like protien